VLLRRAGVASRLPHLSRLSRTTFLSTRASASRQFGAMVRVRYINREKSLENTFTGAQLNYHENTFTGAHLN
jgi:hypothetical protein